VVGDRSEERGRDQKDGHGREEVGEEPVDGLSDLNHGELLLLLNVDQMQGTMCGSQVCRLQIGTFCELAMQRYGEDNNERDGRRGEQEVHDAGLPRCVTVCREELRLLVCNPCCKMGTKVQLIAYSPRDGGFR